MVHAMRIDEVGSFHLSTSNMCYASNKMLMSEVLRIIGARNIVHVADTNVTHGDNYRHLLSACCSDTGSCTSGSCCLETGC